MNLLSTATSPAETFSKFKPKNKFQAFLNFPLIRVLSIAVFLVPVFLLNSLIVFQIIEALDEPAATYVNILRMLISIPLFLLSYHYYCSIIEKRQAVELNLKGGLGLWAFGAIVSVTLVSAFVLLIEVTGNFEIIQIRSFMTLISNFAFFSIGALFQDFVLLCIVFRLTEEIAGTWAAIILSLLLFSGIHLMNENETLLSVGMLFLSSLIMIAPYVLTRRIWLTWGFHSWWNFMQAGVFGMANSGLMFEGWIISKVSGPAWITGGEVGLEASYLSVLIDFGIGIALLVLALKSGKFVSSQRKREG